MPASAHDVVIEKIADFMTEDLPPVFPRDLELGAIQPPARGNIVYTVVGVRRCGKTYRLYQEMNRIIESGWPKGSMLYFNFEDERLKPYSPDLLSDVVDTFFALNPQAKDGGAYFFFDEPQEVPGWGTFMRRMVDTQRVTIYVTGSSSKMLSTEVASEFRGRSLPRELFPMGLGEFARYQGWSAPPAQGAPFGSRDAAHLRNALSRYLIRGGFIATQGLPPSDAILTLQGYASRTVASDIVERYGLANPRLASAALARCIASSGREFSVNKTCNALKSAGLRISRDTISRLLDYYEDSYLCFRIPDFGRSIEGAERASSKVYAVDPGMLVAFSPAASRDEGQLLETAVFAKLRRTSGLVRSGAVSRLLLEDGGRRHEVDFMVGDALFGEARQLVQASVSLSDEKTRRREISALTLAMRRFSVDESWVVTLDEEQEIETEAGTVHVVPAWKWLV